MRSSLSYAIMALLATKPQSGYDIARQMRAPNAFLWQANHGQIYPELARLVKARLVDFKKDAAGSGPPRKVHALTPAGKAELARWVSQNPTERATNDEFVIKAYMLRSIPKAEAIGLIGQQIATHEARLGVLESRAGALASRGRPSAHSTAARFGEQAALRRAIGSEREYLAWCRWLLTELAPQRIRSPRRRSRSAV